MPSRRSGPLAVAALALAAGSASATWSILIADTRTGEIALGSATCLTGFDLRAGTPVIVTGVGAATAQSAVDASGLNRIFIRDRLVEGLSPDEVLEALEGFDPAHQSRQYGFVDVLGRTATFSGTGAAEWKGGVTGRIEAGQPGPADDLVYAVQGNILVGPEPVLAAEQALMDTPGDLAAKLMAAMEAAKVWGGDGRCSCSAEMPTACGAPPPAPFKSAHIGYMLISRPGDVDACRSIYPIGDRPGVVIPADLDGQGGLDVIAAPFVGPQIVTFHNTTEPGDAFLTLGEAGFLAAGADRIRGLAVGDVTGDGVLDLVATAQLPASVRLYPGTQGPAGVVFGAGASVALASAPWKVGVANLDGQHALDVVVTTNTGVTALLSDGAGGWAAPVHTPLAGSPRGLDAGQFNGAGFDDAVVSLFSASGVVLLSGNGDGTFTAAPTLPTDAQPQTVRAAHLGGDAAIDFVTANASPRTATVLLSGPGGWAPTTLEVTSGSTADAHPVHLDGDGLLDVLAMGVSVGKAFLNDGAGGWVLASEARLGEGGILGAGAFDLSGDGLAELITGGSQSRALVLIANHAGVLQDGLGCGAGDHYMALNTGARGAAAPDPVDLLRDDYDAWSASLAGRPDAARSVVSGPALVVRGSEVALSVVLRDRYGAAVGGGAALEVSSEGAVALVTADDLGGGAYTLRLKAEFIGTDRVRIVVDDAAGPVRLIPEFVVRVVDDSADLTGDGVVNIDDVYAFIAAFLNGENAADLNADGHLNVEDVQILVGFFSGPG